MPKGRFASVRGLGKKNRAPLVETDRDELGDKRLSPEEGVVMLREKALKQAANHRIPHQVELENPDREYGPRIPHDMLMLRLAKLNTAISFKDGSLGNIAVYFPRNTDELTEALHEGGPKDEFFIFNKYVGGFPKTEIPEYSYVDLDTSKLATREHTRSWRSVLIGLIKAGVLSYQKAIAEFGDPATDQRSARWFRETTEWRQKPTEAFTRRQLA